MIETIFTFGMGQAYPSGFVRIEAASAQQARVTMHEFFLTRWCGDYNSPAEAGVERWGLREVRICLECRRPASMPWGQTPSALETFWREHPQGLCECQGWKTRAADDALDLAASLSLGITGAVERLRS